MNAPQTITHSGKITYLQFVPHHQVETFKANGWVIDDLLASCPHGEFSVLMRWTGEGEPK